MKKVLIAYASRSGNTDKMAQFLAEGIRFAGHDVELKKISTIEKADDLNGYDGYVFGCPTYHKDITGGMKQFLFLAENAGLSGMTGAAFGSHTHSGESAPMIFDTMEYVFKMKMTSLGPLNLTESMITTQEGQKACQDYGKAVAETL
jgi:flavodoxin